MKKEFCVVQYYRVEIIVEAENEEEAFSMVQDDDRNYYTVTATLDHAENDVKSLGVWAADIDTEIYTT